MDVKIRTIPSFFKPATVTYLHTIRSIINDKYSTKLFHMSIVFYLKWNYNVKYCVIL